MKVSVAILEKERNLGDQAEVESLVEVDFLGRDPLGLVSRHLGVLTLPALVRHVARPIVGYVIGLQEPILTARARAIWPRTAPVP